MNENKTSSLNFLNIKLKCPKCGHIYTRKLKLPEPQIKVKKIECLKCGHKWTYRGMLKSRIRCPQCHSSKNKVNREIFGKYKPPS